MAYTIAQAPTLGVPDLSGVYVASALGAPGVGGLPSIPTEVQPGQIVSAYGYSATAEGGAEFILLAVPTSTTVTAGLLYRWNATNHSIVVVPTAVSSSALSGAPVAVAINAVASNATSLQYTWFQIQGRCSVLKNSTLSQMVPDRAVYVSGTTAGRVRGTASIFRTILGMRTANLATVLSTTSTLLVYLHRPVIGPGV